MMALFQEKQKFLYAILNNVLQTDIGKTIVRSHLIDKDVQKVYVVLKEHQLKLTQASILSLNRLPIKDHSCKIINGYQR